MDPKTLALVLSIAFLVLCLGIHEAAHAWTAHKCGDDTAKNEGRMTLNPVVHIDPFMTILLPAFLAMTSGVVFGGARPVPVDPTRLRKPAFHMVLVAAAGPLSNLVLAVLFFVVFKILVYPMGMDPKALAPQVMLMTAGLNALLVIFNLLPLPPLDGSRVLAFFLPRGLRETYVSLERFGMLIIFLLLMSGGLSAMLREGTVTMIEWIDVLTGGPWR